MCGGSPPEDNSAQVAEINAREATAAREAQAQKDAEQRSRFESGLSSAYSTGTSSARDYFASQGLDPDEYTRAITSAANNAKSRVTDLDASPGTYFENLGASVYGQEQDAQRARALRGFDSFAREGFATRRIANDTDDPFLESVLAESRATADGYARNLLDRGVITQSGFTAALEDLDGQSAGANSRLQDIGLSELERGRGQLRDIASTGRSAASQLNLGDIFDPYSYQGDIDTAQADFFAGLGDSIRGSAPDDLFNTAGLAGIAGAAQGAQNTGFNPDALAGIEGDEEDEDEDEDEDEFVAF